MRRARVNTICNTLTLKLDHSILTHGQCLSIFCHDDRERQMSHPQLLEQSWANQCTCIPHVLQIMIFLKCFRIFLFTFKEEALKIYYQDLSTVFPKGKTTFYGVFLLRLSLYSTFDCKEVNNSKALLGTVIGEYSLIASMHNL